MADKFAADANHKVCSVKSIEDGWMGLDIGPASIEAFGKEIAAADTVVWNGPMGVFEFENFAKGTFTVAEQLAAATARGATTIVGGGVWDAGKDSRPRGPCARRGIDALRTVGIPATEALMVMPARIHSSTIHSAVRSSNQFMSISSASRISYSGVST